MFKTTGRRLRSVRRMPKTITAAFEITRWDEKPYHEGEGPKLSRIVVGKTFRGALEGTSVAELLTAVTEGGRGYVASERVEGSLDGRRGSFVLQHYGVDDGRDKKSAGHVVPGSGTGELRGLRGDVVYAHDENGARVTLTFSFEAAG